jgi:hypothetical protein
MLIAALAACIAGFAWLALAMDAHWLQVRGEPAGRGRTRLALRLLGAAALLGALLVCLRVDHASMAVLVWVMALAAAALVVAFTLSWRPRWLAPLVAWIRPRA